MSSASPTRSPIGMRGLSEACESWKMICSLRRMRRRLATVEPAEIGAVEQHAAGAGPDELQDGVAGRRLAAARFAHQPQGAAALDAEAHAVDGLHRAGSARPAVMDVEVFDFEKPAHGAEVGEAGRPSGRRRTGAAAAAAAWQAATETRQRGRNGQSVMRIDQVGRHALDRRQAARTRAVDPRRRAHEAQRVAMARPVEQLADRPRFDDASRHT